MEKEYCEGNWTQLAKKDYRHLTKIEPQITDVRCLSEEHWKFLLETATLMADDDLRNERNLFLIAALKTLFLTISEFSERPGWIPVMGHFWEDDDNNWWLKIYGKSRKIRDITVPSSFIPYLKRYRLYRGMSSMPLKGENHIIIKKLYGSGSMQTRQLSLLVHDVFEQSYKRMRNQKGEEVAYKFKEASALWLRHTGASLEVKRGRPIKDLSKDLGHSNIGFTDTVYVPPEDKRSAKTGKNRPV